jgi:hypothetical protein
MLRRKAPNETFLTLSACEVVGELDMQNSGRFDMT